MDGSMFVGTWWSLVPPLLAILLAFITKEVYSSLFIGIVIIGDDLAQRIGHGLDEIAIGRIA